MNELAAVLFDLDGTLIDSEPKWAIAERRLAEQHGGTWSQHDADRTVGKSLRFTSEQLHAGGVQLPVHEIMTELLESVARTIANEGVALQPGAEALIRAVEAAGVPFALVSSSYRIHIDAVLPQLPVSFAVTVAGDEVQQEKPNPEGYVRALEVLGVEAENAVVIEDSLSGVRAGLAAGAAVIAVPSVAANADEMAALGAAVHTSLTEVDIETCRAVVQRIN